MVLQYDADSNAQRAREIENKLRVGDALDLFLATAARGTALAGSTADARAARAKLAGASTILSRENLRVRRADFEEGKREPWWPDEAR